MPPAKRYRCTQLLKAICAGCGSDLSAATGDGTPKTGDLCICVDCGFLQRFAGPQRVEPLSPADEAGLHPDSQREVARMRSLIKRARGSRS